MNGLTIIKEFRSLGAQMWANGDRIEVEAPAGAITPEMRDCLKRHKAEVLAVLELAHHMTLYGKRNSFSKQDHDEAMQNAMADVAGWLAYLCRENETRH